MVLGCELLMPVAASGQLGAVPGSLTITIAQPSSGASVSATIEVRAEVTGPGASTVVGVQFELDGQTLGAEDLDAPYSIPWGTLTSADGVHTLVAVARDIVGTLHASEPAMVTVWNESTPPPVIVNRIEETSSAVVYEPSGTWLLDNPDRDWSGGTAALGFAAGQRASFTFNGGGVSWIGFRGPQAGIAHVYVDGIKAATVDAYASEERVSTVLYAVTGLEFGTHTLTIEPTGTRNPLSNDYFVVVDAFDVVSRPQ